MEKDIIKEALSYDLASEMHEVWRNSRLNSDGTYEPRIKHTDDEEWIESHLTSEVDIANHTFSELPKEWQYENISAARFVIDLVYERVMKGKTFTNNELEVMGAMIHSEWLKRNKWVYDPNNGNRDLAVTYIHLTRAEQNKDIAQVVPAVKKVKDYCDGLIDIDELCIRYKIKGNERTKK